MRISTTSLLSSEGIFAKPRSCPHTRPAPVSSITRVCSPYVISNTDTTPLRKRWHAHSGTKVPTLASVNSVTASTRPIQCLVPVPLNTCACQDRLHLSLNGHVCNCEEEHSELQRPHIHNIAVGRSLDARGLTHTIARGMYRSELVCGNAAVQPDLEGPELM